MEEYLNDNDKFKNLDQINILHSAYPFDPQISVVMERNGAKQYQSD